MEKSEPTLVPEWLKNAGSLNGGGSISHSDDHASGKFVRNKSFVNSNRSDRANSSSYRRSSSSNGSSNPNPYSNFGRNRHDRDWGKDTYDSNDRNKVILGDTLSGKFERDGLRRSQSMIKHVDTWPKRGVIDSSSNNGLLTKKGTTVGGVKKTNFERDFPSLGIEERTITSEIRRVPSPGLSSAIQSLPFGNAATIGGEKWTSALAEIPALVGSKGNGDPSSQVITSLNMAEAVAQGPSRAQTTTPQSYAGAQKLEELAIKQSRQLIPMTPSMPKALVSTSSDKQKTKGGPHPIPSLLAVNHSPRGGPIKGDIPKTSLNVGKLQILKPVREKDNLSPTIAITPSVSANRGPTVLEKRPTSQALSRKEFFNSVREKSVPNTPSVAESSDKPTEIDVVPAGGVSPNGAHLCEVEPSSDPVVPDEEEAAFLRSLGWEENSDEGGLTEDEINAFFRDVAKYIKSKPSHKILQGVKPKFSSPYDSKMGAISSGLNPPDAKLES